MEETIKIRECNTIYQRLLIKKRTLTIFNYTDCVNYDPNERFQDRFHFEFNVLDKKKKEEDVRRDRNVTKKEWRGQGLNED